MREENFVNNMMALNVTSNGLVSLQKMAQLQVTNLFRVLCPGDRAVHTRIGFFLNLKNSYLVYFRTYSPLALQDEHQAEIFFFAVS